VIVEPKYSENLKRVMYLAIGSINILNVFYPYLSDTVHITSVSEGVRQEAQAAKACAFCL